jgi:hypothetical protein
MEWFIDGTQPQKYDNIYHSVQIDTLTGFQADVNTPPERIRQLITLDLPPQAHDWARSHELVLYSDLASGADSEIVANENGASQLLISSPGSNSVFRLSDAINSDLQQLHIQAMASTDIQAVSIWLDGEILKTFSDPPFEIWWPLEIGSHALWAEGIGSNGETISSPQVLFSVETDEEP